MTVVLKTLKKRADFLRVGQSTLKYNCPFFIIKGALSAEPGEISKVGYTVTKKIGGAVVRNKIKRQLRVLCRILLKNFIKGYEYVIIIRTGFLTLSFKEMEIQLAKSLTYFQRKSI